MSFDDLFKGAAIGTVEGVGAAFSAALGMACHVAFWRACVGTVMVLGTSTMVVGAALAHCC